MRLSRRSAVPTRRRFAVREATQGALAEVRRVKSILKKPTKAVIARAVLPMAYRGLGPAARDFHAATHIRDLDFADVAEAQLEFAEDPVAPETRA